MIKHLIYSCAIILISIVGIEPVNANGNKSAELRLKMDEISSLRHSLTEKIALAIEKKGQLEIKARELEKEIRVQKDQYSIKTYQKAVLNPRIDYNLKLIQLLLGYITRLDDKIAYFKNGYSMLNFFYQQAQDDLMMIKTLDDLEIDKLLAQINEILDEYTPAAGKPMFDADDVPLKDTRLIWKNIVKTN